MRSYLLLRYHLFDIMLCESKREVHSMRNNKLNGLMHRRDRSMNSISHVSQLSVFNRNDLWTLIVAFVLLLIIAPFVNSDDSEIDANE
jgi:hypothetical protein